MQCYNPRLAFRTFDNTKIKFTGLAWSTYIIHPKSKKPILKKQFNTIFSKYKNADLTQPLKIPCGKCEVCVLNRARDLAKRAYDEFRFPTGKGQGRTRKGPPQPFTGMFLTLTYSNEHLPSCGHFDEQDLVLFVKRLRKNCPVQIRTLGVAEYGENTGRAHFHLLVFGYEFKDKKLLRNTNSTHSGQSYDIFESKMLQKLWNKGISEFGSVTEQSCSYVARYMFKKNKKEKHGEYCEVCKNKKPLKSKVICRSRRPGLGSQFCDSFVSVDRARRFIMGDSSRESLPRFYIDRVRRLSSECDREGLTSQPNFTKDRSKETQERINDEKIINKARLKNLYKTKI